MSTEEKEEALRVVAEGTPGGIALPSPLVSLTPFQVVNPPTEEGAPAPRPGARIQRDLLGGPDVDLDERDLNNETDEFIAQAREEFSDQEIRDEVDSIEDGDITSDFSFEVFRFLQNDANLRRFAAAFHGTPHDFDEFSTDAIGTGEGAQADGCGRDAVPLAVER